MTRKHLLGAATLAGVLLLACRPSQTVEGQTDDAAIKTRIKTRLATDVNAATLTSVDVNVTAGIVTLAGPVSSEAERAQIGEVVRSVEGVVSVTNNLQVLAQPQVVTPAEAVTPGTPPTAVP